MRNFVLAVCAAFPVAFGGPAGFAADNDATNNDYPTVTRADYVYACMQVNGPTRESLEKCSCSIDQIAGLIRFAEYEEAETIHSLELRGGESVNFARQPKMQEKLLNLKRAQVEAELRCF